MRRTLPQLISTTLLVLWPWQSACSAAAVDDYLARDWYVTEVIIFQRPAVMEFNTAERLIIERPAALPRAMRTHFTKPPQWGRDYRLDEATLATLEPAFSTTRAPATFAVPGRAAPLQLPLKLEADDPYAIPPPTITPALAPNELMDFLSAVGEFEESLIAASYQWTPAGEHVLRRSSAVVTRRFGSRVLLHGRWLQPVPPRGSAEPLYIASGFRAAETHQLEGTLSVTLGRYLHFHAQLAYREPGFGQHPVSVPFASDPLSETPLPLPQAVPGYMVLNESRRMRSEEVHYLDHPKLGIIVRVDPVEIPEVLAARLQALQESDE